MRSIYRNATALSVAHVVGYIIPLLEIPILARALGPEAYGHVVFFQSIALLSSLFVEYGFNLSASRQVARSQDDRILLGRIFADIFLAKAILSFCVIAALATLILATNAHGSVSNIGMVFWATVYFVAFGFSPFWYFQGRERMIGVVVLELGLRLIGLSFLFALVRSDQEATLALAIMSSVGVANTALSTAWCLREVAPLSICLTGAITQIRQGVHVFLYRSSNNILLSAAPSVLGYAAGSVALASFVPAEKVIRGVVGFGTPVLTALFPYFSRNFVEPNKQPLRLALLVILSISLFGATCAVILWFFGPMLLNIVLGAQYESTGKLLRYFVWLIPLRMTNQALGMVLLIPARKDRAASVLLMIFSMLALVLGGALSSHIGVLGMVIGFLVAEALLMTSLVAVSLQMAPEILPSALRFGRKAIGEDQ